MISYNKIKNCIDTLKEKGINQFAIYPYGEQGRMIKEILENNFDIEDIKIYDNLLCKENSSIYPIAKVENDNNPKSVILITSENPTYYKEVREELYRYTEQTKCIDLFPIETEETKMMEMVLKSKEMKMGYFKPQYTHSKFFIPFWGTDLIQNTIFMEEEYFEQVLLKNVCFNYFNGKIGKQIDGGCVLDIGANIGNHTLFYCNECKARIVYSFEPVKATFEILKENIHINGLNSRVSLNNFGIGQSSGMAKVDKIDSTNIGGTSLKEDVDNGNIRICSLDELTIKDKVDFVKIDVEGMEEKVFLGGQKFFKVQHPYIQVESFPDKYDRVDKLLKDMGYKCLKKLSVSDYLYY